MNVTFHVAKSIIYWNCGVAGRSSVVGRADNAARRLSNCVVLKRETGGITITAESRAVGLLFVMLHKRCRNGFSGLGSWRCGRVGRKRL